MESITYTVAGKEFELQHFGVKGMKWGKRKARPEAVGVGRQGGKAATDSPEAEAAAKAARRQKVKRTIAIGGAVVGTALAAYGAYKITKMVKQRQAGKAAMTRMLENAAWERQFGMRPGESVHQKYDAAGKLVSSVSNITTPRAGETIREVWDAAGNVVDRRRS